MRKFWKVGSIIFVIIIFVSAGAYWFFAYHFESLVKKQLEAQAEQVLDGLYHLKIEKLKISLVNGSLKAANITFSPDSSRLAYLLSVDSLPSDYADIKIKNINVKGVNFRKYIGLRTLNFTSINIKSPQVILTRNTHGNGGTGKKTSFPDLYEIISPVFDKISVKEINIENGLVEHYNLEGLNDTNSLQILKDINFYANNVVIDSTETHNSHTFYCEDIRLNVEEFHFLLPGKNYEMNARKLALNVKDSMLVTESLQLLPRYPKFEFAYKVPEHSDWTDLKIKNIACSGLDVRELLSGESIRMDSLLLDGVDFQNYKNQKIKIQHHKMPLIYEMLQKFTLPVVVQSLKVTNMNVVYEELAKDGNKPGKIFFSDINGDFEGVTNIVSSHNQYIQLQASGKLMNEGVIHAIFKLPVDSLNDRMEISGSMSKMSMLSLNRIIEPLTPVRIEQGYIHGMDFHIIAGTKGANVNLLLLYNGLQIKLLEDYQVSKSFAIEQNMASFFANKVLLKNNNPDSGKEPRRIQVYHVRDPYHSTFNYFWKIFFTGIKETVGM